jgi:hypothetical protein
VGALDERGRARVSGGPLLEWRPTLADEDRVLVRQRGDPGTRWRFDDDSDGRLDEELLNRRDEDGDGRIDEDLGFTADRLYAADYTDDQPEAVNYVYETGEAHVPLGLHVHQEVYGWSRPGFNRIAGLHYIVTNRSDRALENVYVGLLSDVDLRMRDDRRGHLDDRFETRTFARSVNEGNPTPITIGGITPGGPQAPPPGPCFTNLRATIPVALDGNASSGMPLVTMVPLDHTTDPLAFIPPALPYARAPAVRSFRTAVFSTEGRPGQGGLPRLDAERLAALQGNLAQSSREETDQNFMVACGPFVRLGPGESLTFSAALVMGESADSLAVMVQNALYLHHGVRFNLLPDYTGRLPRPTEYNIGLTGINGHEVCIQPPAGVSFTWDPDCVDKFPDDIRPIPTIATYVHGQCIWTDADCSACTGFGGFDTVVRWLDPGQVPPPPGRRIEAGDHVVRVDWDNVPEILLEAEQYGTAQSTFLGYRVYRMGDWRNRTGLLPPLENWSLVAAFGTDTLNGEVPLAAVTDTTVDPDGTLFGMPRYPPGRYSFVDRTAQNGFDYVYVVTSVYQLRQLLEVAILESPITTTYEERVSPQAAARQSASGVWVVPNPYRASASWERPEVFGDPLPRHIDFMGLPLARSIIKIWTVAGDLVAIIDHDGSGGDGQAAWNLLSRNGQEVESGIYLFTVESSLGSSRGRFVVIR